MTSFFDTLATHLSKITPPDRHGLSLPLCATAGAASLALLAVLRALEVNNDHRPRILPSPRTTQLPSLSASDIRDLAYPPDVLPGGRDVESPYGTFRVHEWGPEGGQKVLFVHGASTPLIAFAPMAQHLVARGYRVMLFDLFGRGYSDAPTDLPYDSRLYTSQILLALQSSPLAWTGAANAFALIGYSLGGGLAADFASYFPHLLSSLVLIAPGGVVRDTHVTWSSKLLYNSRGLLPETLVHWLVGRRLYSGPSSPLPSVKNVSAIDNAAEAEAGDVHRDCGTAGGDSYTRGHDMGPDPANLVPGRPNVTVNGAVDWQLAQHAGFLPAFVSSIRYAPVHNQHHRWRIIGQRLSAQKHDAAGPVAQRRGLGKVLLLLGASDPIVLRDEMTGDAESVLGTGNVEIVVLDAGHEVPMSRSRECVDAMERFWGMGFEEDEEI